MCIVKVEFIVQILLRVEKLFIDLILLMHIQYIGFPLKCTFNYMQHVYTIELVLL